MNRHQRAYRTSAPTLYGDTFETFMVWLARVAIALVFVVLVLAIARSVI